MGLNMRLLKKHLMTIDDDPFKTIPQVPYFDRSIVMALAAERAEENILGRVRCNFNGGYGAFVVPIDLSCTYVIVSNVSVVVVVVVQTRRLLHRYY
jgi:hypothetical protein